MSSLRDRRKHQNRVEAIAEALDLSHKTTTNVPQALASAEVSSSDNPTYLGSLPDDHAHTQAKGDSTNQHMDLYRGATGENLCSECIGTAKIFDFEAGILVRSWRTLDLLAYVDQNYRAPERMWKVTNNIDKACSFCSFLMDCASRMAIHTACDLKSEDWFLAIGVKLLQSVTGNASGERPRDKLSTQVLELRLCQKPYDPTDPTDLTDPFRTPSMVQWRDLHLILPVQPHDNDNYEVSDTLDWKVIVKWLETCQSHHDYNCRTDLTTTTLENIPSFCLIDCMTQTIIPAAQIKNLSYVTLSYVWGGPLTTPQVVDAGTSLPLLPESSQRSKVVNDAMEVVRRVGYRYLWVDRFCISQSDHNVKDIQIKNMGKIYSMSVLSIIAAAGKDAEYGLPGVSSRPTLQPVWTTIRNGNRVMPVVHFEPPNNDILNSTWNSRGWTYQEALLSKRRLVFTDRHVYFQCESMQTVGSYNPHSESYYLDPYFAASEVFPVRQYYGDPALQPWDDSIWTVISDYNERTLSYEEDTINAVQGILESFRDLCDVWFFYGLPVMSPSASDIPLDSFHNDSAMPDVLSLPVGTFRAVDSGTQDILNSLFWKDWWGTLTKAMTPSIQSSRFSDQSRLEVRRTGFPSWTWAGWRMVRGLSLPVSRWGERDILYYIPDHCSFSIRLSYDDKDLSWPRDRRDIQHRSEITSRFPNFLVITGPVFDVTITCADGEGLHSSSYQTGHVVWRYASPPFLVHLQSKFLWAGYKGPQFSPEEVKVRTIHFVALCSFSDEGKDGICFHMLLLRPVGEDAYGQIYERVTGNDLYSSDFPPNFKLADIEVREMELRIR